MQQFYVYDADDELAETAQLDGFGEAKDVPELCMNCHGGRVENGVVKDAHFLPFDLNVLPTPESDPQTDQFKGQNFIVWSIENLNPNGDAIAELAAGWYGGPQEFFNPDAQFNPISMSSIKGRCDVTTVRRDSA